MPFRIRGVSNLLYSDEEMSVPRLTADGLHVEGWVMAPQGKVWQPHDRDPLLWMPPSATKSSDIDQAGSIVDVTWAPGEEKAWVQAQINKHDRYLDVIRDRVRAGKVRLTAFLAKMLGLPFEDGAELMPYNPLVSAPLASMKAASEAAALAARVEYLRREAALASTAPPDAERIKTIARAASEKFARTGDLAGALDGIFAAVGGKSAPIDPDTGLPDIGRS